MEPLSRGMKILSGKYKGKEIKSPTGKDIRPTLARIRESIFNILIHRFDLVFNELIILDLFAGSGSFGLESISRGSDHTIFVDNNISSIKCINDNLARLGVVDKFTLIESDVVGFGFNKNLLGGVNLAFLDPPYSTNLIADSLLYISQNGYLNKDALVVIELARGKILDIVDGFSWEHEVSHGKTSVIFLRYN